MSLHLYNSQTKSLELFASLRDREVKLYSCGPTVYDTPHLGNYRSYLSWDLLKRLLTFLDYRVEHVMNITDVGHMTDDDLITSDTGEDKMEKAARREHKTVWDIARFYEEQFFEGYDRLKLQRPKIVCRATEHISQMISMIEELLEKEYAYCTSSGVYFDIGKFSEYGKLSGNTLATLNAGASGRVEERDEKKSPHDFVLWVLGKEQSMMWDSPWGRGYPGWHIECSAMCIHYLGEHIDIHTGGMDNKFPHHECEIAQSEASSGKSPFVRYWLHGGMITVDGQKMSKSKNNFLTLADLAKFSADERVFRMVVLSVHYRSTMDISKKIFEQAKKNVLVFDRMVERLQGNGLREGGVRKEFSQQVNQSLLLFIEALEDDMNTSVALSALFELLRSWNTDLDQGILTQGDAQAAYAYLETLHFIFPVILPWSSTEEDIPEDIVALLEQRNAAKHNKNFTLADELRKSIQDKGYVVEDKKDGSIVRKQ